MKLLKTFLLLFSTITIAQSNSTFNDRYYDHWETVNPEKSLLEIIIYKSKQTTRVVELDFNSKCDDLGTNILFQTIYVHKKRNGNMAVETINPSTLQILNSDYIISKNDELLRVNNNDTIVFKRRYIFK